ncbi:MAG: putative lipid II flippase FtsW [Deltaproteobacteria bacterium]|nr:MAG: putative lipid II flippase FtsW [Deltaproteobacteria bacterium]
MTETGYKDRFAYDGWILFPVIILVGIGMVMVFSSSSMLAMREAASAFHYFQRQAIFAMVGFGVLIFFRHFPYRFFNMQKMAYLVLLVSLAALIMVEIPGLGTSAGGATRWVNLGVISFQPSEMVKVGVVIFLAYSLTRKQDCLDRWTVSLLPHVLILAPFALLILLQPDFGSFVVITLITLIMLFVGGVRVFHLLVAIGPISAFSIWYLFQAPYRKARWLAFLDPEKYQNEFAYQLHQSLIAFASGGLWGQGFGQGRQKMFYLPEPHTDFIFSIIGEELGFLGVMTVIMLYTALIFRGIVIASRAGDRFGALLAGGLTTVLGIQICINMGVTLGLLPTKGLTLPFLSYGGTALLVDMACVGILMNIGLNQQQGEDNGSVHSVRRRRNRRTPVSGYRHRRGIPAAGSR